MSLSEAERQHFVEISTRLATFDQHCDRFADRPRPTGASDGGAQTWLAVGYFSVATGLSVVAALCTGGLGAVLSLTGTGVLLLVGGWTLTRAGAPDSAPAADGSR